jgi:small subunit ribosomal protein S1
VDRNTRRLTLSIKVREVEEEKKAMADYGSSDSGASLGDILGAALRRAREEAGSKEDESREGEGREDETS